MEQLATLEAELASLQAERDRLAGLIAEDEAALVPAEERLAAVQGDYDEAGALFAQAARALHGDGGIQHISPEQWRRDSGEDAGGLEQAQRDYDAARAAHQAADDALRVALVERNSIAQRRSAYRGRLRALDGAIEQLEARLERVRAQQVQRLDLRGQLLALRDRLFGSAA